MTKNKISDVNNMNEIFYDEFNIDKEYDQGLFTDEAGTKIVENRVNGVTVKETKYRPNGDVRKITEFKDSKPI